MLIPNRDHFPLTPVFINPSNFALMTMLYFRKLKLADGSQPILIFRKKKRADSLLKKTKWKPEKKKIPINKISN